MAARRRSRAPNGDGSVYKETTAKGKTRWVAQLRLPGTDRYWKRRFHTRAEANDARLAKLAEFARPSQPLTVGEWLAEWLETVVKPSRSTGTLRTYESPVRLYLVPRLAHVPLTALTAADVRAFAVALGRERTPHVARMAVTVLSVALAEAERRELVTRNVARIAKPPPPRQPEPVPPPPALVETALAALGDHPCRTAMFVALGLGVRLGEVLGLRWADIDRERGLVHVRGQVVIVPPRLRAPGDAPVQWRPTKTRAGVRSLPAPPEVFEALAERRVQWEQERSAARVWHASDLIFCTRTGRAVLPNQYGVALARALTAAGLDARALSPHDLRHAAASGWAAAGVHTRTLMALLGHSSPRMSQHYTHATDTAMLAAAAAMSERLRAMRAQSQREARVSDSRTQAPDESRAPP